MSIYINPERYAFSSPLIVGKKKANNQKRLATEEVADKMKIADSSPQRKKKVKVLEEQATSNNSKVKFITDKSNTIYYTHPDKHGGKHLALGSQAQQYHSDAKKFIAATKGGPAKFFPNRINQDNYADMLEACVKRWVEQGADQANRFVEAEWVIGADQGHPTNVIEIYGGTDTIGAHMRPKYLR